jgi:glyoxylase-like metal-dependent hydrolase (beta-lactamase superfamily II)
VDRAVPTLAGQLDRLRARIAERDDQIRLRRNADGDPLADEEIEALRARQAVFREAVASLESVDPTHPTDHVDQTRQVRVGSLAVTIEHLGRGHSEGDLVVTVPSRGVLVAGDLVTLPVPAAAEAFVSDWIDVLGEVARRPWEVIVPGHGAPTTDRVYLEALTMLMQQTRAHVVDGIERNLSLEDILAQATFPDFTTRYLSEAGSAEAMFAAFYIDPAIRALYADLTGR